MTEAERDIFVHLPDLEARRDFIKDFWEKRDPDPETPDNEFRTEFEKRIDYVTKRFNEGQRGYQHRPGPDLSLSRSAGPVRGIPGLPDGQPNGNDPGLVLFPL